jgi:hypothetical protein
MDRTKSITTHRKRVGVTLFCLGAVLAIGWPVASLVNWTHIIDSHARLGYLIGDLGLVVPLSFLGWYGLTRGRVWAPGVFLVFAGAAAFDSLHFGIYLIQEKFLSIPAPIFVILILVCLGILAWLAGWEIQIERTGANAP